MMLGRDDSKATLDRAIAAIREDDLSTEFVEGASERAWQAICQGGPAGARPGMTVNAASLQNASLQGCAGVLSLLPEYRARRLPAGRMMLVEDHLHECVSCRLKAEKENRAWTSILPWEQQRAERKAWPWFRYALAATIVLAAAIALPLKTLYFSPPPGSRATLQSVQGAFYRVTAAGERRVWPGEEFFEGDLARTGRDSRAMVRLTDGSLVEMNGGAELSVSATRRDAVIHFDRGNIIVQAAKRHSGHLYVVTPDCKVSVTGTVFAVDSGLKGSRVAVIEGEVRVAQENGLKVLHPGDEVATSTSVGQVPMREEIAWSSNVDQHLALLAEFSKLENKLSTISLPELRYQSRLLASVPEDSLVFASVANYGQALTEANRLFQQQLEESDVLRQWWQGGPGKSGEFAQTVEKLQELSQYLGNEIVFSGGSYHGARDRALLVAAEVKKPGLREFLNGIAQADPHRVGLHLVSEDQLASEPDKEAVGLMVLVGPDFIVASTSTDGLRNFVAQWKQPASGTGFPQSPFGQRIAAAYTQGVGILFAADLQQMASAGASHGAGAVLDASGFKDGKYLIVERRDISGQVLNTAELSFTASRKGIAAWLAPPAPIGALDFVTPNATLVSAFVMKTPAQMFDDILAVSRATNANDQWLPELESKVNLNLRDDLMGSFGSDAALAIDGPLLPTPSYKLVVQVNDSDRLRYSIQKLIEAANRDFAESGKSSIRLESELAGGRTFYEIVYTGEGASAGVYYTFADGYLIAAPNRALLLDAIHARESGDSLAHSAQFRSLLPSDGQANVSGVLYQNLSSVLGSLASRLSVSQLHSLQLLTASSKPSLMCAYGEDDRISLASNGEESGLNLAVFSLLLRMQGGTSGSATP